MSEIKTYGGHNVVITALHDNLVCRFPAGTQRNNNVFITSKRRRRRRFDVMKTLSLRHYCVMCPLSCGLLLGCALGVTGSFS